jgi:hypothetical protein
MGPWCSAWQRFSLKLNLAFEEPETEEEGDLLNIEP